MTVKQLIEKLLATPESFEYTVVFKDPNNIYVLTAEDIEVTHSAKEVLLF